MVLVVEMIKICTENFRWRCNLDHCLYKFKVAFKCFIYRKFTLFPSLVQKTWMVVNMEAAFLLQDRDSPADVY